MKYIKSLNEGEVIDEKSNKVIFDSDKTYTLSQFIKIAKGSVEGKHAYDGDYNFGKGIKLAEALKKSLGHLPFQCRVGRNAWNYGGNLYVSIELRGKSYREIMFRFNSANSTRQPSYSFSPLFQGTTKASTGEVVKDWDMGTIHGSYQSISKFDEFIGDIVHVFNDYERVNGEAFSFKSAMKIFKEKAKLREAWNKLEPKVEKEYMAAKSMAKKVNRWISMRMPRFEEDKKTVYFKHDEPRELRHPDEYGEVPELETKEYDKYEKHISKMTDMIEKFCSKFGIEFVWAASW